MKALLTILILIFATTLSAQPIFEVTAKSGLLLRDSPSQKGRRLGKLPYGRDVKIIEKTGIEKTIIDDKKTIKGEWVKVQVGDLQSPNSDLGYVFDGYLISKPEKIKRLQSELNRFEAFQGFSVVKDQSQYHIRGDFFGDGTADVAILIQDTDQSVKVGIIDYGKTDRTILLGQKDDPFSMTNYNWAGQFEVVKRGNILWANYIDDFRDFEDVPENEKVSLPYEAMYLHASEACGGGFIFWKDGKFNWLQQE